MKKPVRKAVFPVAGLGTRFLPATKAIPKEMLPLVDRPLLEHAVDEARAAGIEDFIFVTGRGKRAIEDHFDADWELYKTLQERGNTEALEAVRACEIGPGRLFYTRQQMPLGLGHAVWCAREVVGDDPFAVILPDDFVVADKPCLQQMVEAYQEVGGNIVAVVDVPRDQTQRYGILDVAADDGRLAVVAGLVEKPKPALAPSTLSIIGRYILQPEVMTHLGDIGRGAGGEIQLTDGMARLIGHQPFHGLRFSGTRYDCGSKVGFLEATLAHALTRPDMADQVRETLKRYS
ncbi:MAG: UTP--glucose-1-phosphate uridylyltransferase GalU [Azospirillum sp.]|nr:UTP--glucose-1-phosphate uridylyltransferase GalU [Azospirillum sp.]